MVFDLQQEVKRQESETIKSINKFKARLDDHEKLFKQASKNNLFLNNHQISSK